MKGTKSPERCTQRVLYVFKSARPFPPFVHLQGGTGRPGVVSPQTSSRLFHVRGTTEMNTKAIEVPARATSLNSNDVFVLSAVQKCYLWYGKVRVLL